jgi:hypothetical protein
LEDVVVVGEVAYALSRDSLSVTRRAGGEAMQLTGHRITVHRKRPDGRWLLARDAHTLPETKGLGVFSELRRLPTVFDRRVWEPEKRAQLCAVQRCDSSAGASPARQRSLQPVTIGAAGEVTNSPKPSR